MFNRILSTLIAMMSVVAVVQVGHTATLTDNFDDNTNTGWIYIDRVAQGAGDGTNGGPGDPSFSEQNMRLEQTSTNYDFPTYGTTPGLGSLALSPLVSAGGQYTVSLSMDTLESGADNEDYSVAFGYQDQDNFFYVAFVESSGTDTARLQQISGATNTVLDTETFDFVAGEVPVVLNIDSAAGTVDVTYNSITIATLDAGGPISSGMIGVGSNNDAFAIDNFQVQGDNVALIPEPASVAIWSLLWLGLAGFGYFRVRRAMCNST